MQKAIADRLLAFYRIVRISHLRKNATQSATEKKPQRGFPLSVNDLHKKDASFFVP